MQKTITAICAIVALAVVVIGQDAVRTALISSPDVGDGVSQVASYRYSDHAKANDAGVRIQWLHIAASTNVTVTRVAYDGSYTNAITAIAITAETTTNVYDFAGTSFGIWPATDLITFTGDGTNTAFTARMGLAVTQRIP